MEAQVCLRDQGIDNDYGRVGRVRQARGISNNDEGIGRGRGIYNASDGLETTAEAAGARQQARGIYDNDRGVGGGILAQRLQQQQQRRRRRKTKRPRDWRRRQRRQRINHRPGGLETTTECWFSLLLCC